MRLGSEVLLASRRLHGRRVGVVANPASIDHGFGHIVERVAGADGVTLGGDLRAAARLSSDLQDNMIESPHARDARRQVPVYSLYSETREPTAEMLEGLDALVVDLQDVGTRIYTFIYTMANCLHAAGRHGVPVDRAATGRTRSAASSVEGPMLEPGFESFVGQYPIPMRHGMTVGELAQLFNERFRHRRDAGGRADGRLAS